jgi:hypothetical protein
MASEYVKITGCPKCQGEHKYRLEVMRALVLKWYSPFEMREPPRAVRLTRLFTCPKTQADYQATFTLTDTSSNRIKDVTVLGETGDDEHE